MRDAGPVLFGLGHLCATENPAHPIAHWMPFGGVFWAIRPKRKSVLRSHFFATSNGEPSGRGARRYLPYAFTEHGAIMAATILNSPKAVEMSVYVVRAFVKLREVLASNRGLAKRLTRLDLFGRFTVDVAREAR